ncbi:PBP1A family penicillin-binding protein [Rhizobium puerariae]|uniref:peptidoglycan glycosyltransferase n=1 Tax=Rhizobium puerariae TaxID=1585791 RepID=A0ABV6ANW5_9HYPH
MAARGRSDRRVEPSFEGSRAGDDFRLDADERIAGTGRPARRQPKAERNDDRTERNDRSERAERGRPPRRKAPRRGGGGGGFFGPLRRLVYWCVVLGIWGGIAVGGLVLYYGARMPSASTWTIPDRPPNMKITAIDGSVIANRGSTGGEALALEEMSPYLPQAVIAIEDRRFYYHFGVDPLGLARAFVNNLTGQPIQGGSTITQQLAKNLFLSPERTFERKIQEVLLSFWLEHKFTKDQILAMYLNRVFFGSNAYGVEAASRRYFNKSARDVNLGEAATLAGLLKAPSRLSPARDPQAAEARAQVVLGAMREEGYITDSDLKSAMSQPPAKAKSYWSGAQHYAADMVVDEVKSLIGEPKVDVVVETTIDLRLESAAEKALNDVLKKEGGKLNASQAALVSVDATGAIRAVVGGRDYATSQFNRAARAKRQPGSAFKPFVYAAALEAGNRPDSVRNDAPVKIGNWTPENYDQKYRGEVTLASAFAQSLNTIAAQLVMEVGPDNVVSLAHRLGIESELQSNASIALGTSEVSLVELTSSYASFMNGGYKATPHIVKRISDTDGKVLYEADYTSPPRVLSEPVAATMNSMMNRVINEGTGKAARVDGWQAAGKSGTTQSFRDALFVGYTSIMTTGIWFGNDDGAFMKKVTGGGLPAKAWKEYMTAAMKGYTPTPLFGSGRGLELPPAATQPASEPTTIGDIISGILPGSSRHAQEEPPADYPPAPRPPAQDSASAGNNPHGDRPAYDDRRPRGDIVPPADVPVRDYRQYRGPYDSPGPVPPVEVGGGPIPPGEVGETGSTRQPRQTTLFDILMGQ